MFRSPKTLEIALALSVLVSSPALAQVSRAAPGAPEARTALDLMPAGYHLMVTTPAFKDGGDIPFANTQYRTNTFPGLSWTSGPAGTQSYLVIMQDNDLIFKGSPILHWTMYNIPGSLNSLEPGMTTPPSGSAYGPNYKGPATAYTGPRTPPGVKDHYHFEIFALDTKLADPGGSYAALTAAMTGHILASGEVVGLGQKDPNAPPPAPPPPAAPKTN